MLSATYGAVMSRIFSDRTFPRRGLIALLQTSIVMGIFSATACGGGDAPIPGSGAVGARTCATDGDCAQPDPYCFSGVCVQCLSSNNCGGRQCGPNHQCVECTANTDCGGFTPYCNTTTFQCVQCVGPGNCGQGLTCNAATNRCELACTSDANCTQIAPHCSPTLGVCVGCVTDANCSGGAPYCDVQDGACVECLTDANCTGGNRGGGGTCRGFRCR